MERYFLLVGDCMPHTNRVHLPSWDSQKFVFERYREDVVSQGGQECDVVALRTFYRIWKEEFSHVVIPEVCNNLFFMVMFIYDFFFFH